MRSVVSYRWSTCAALSTADLVNLVRRLSTPFNGPRWRSSGVHSLCIVYRKLMPMPNCSPFRPSSPFRNTKGREKFSSNLAAG